MTTTLRPERGLRGAVTRKPKPRPRPSNGPDRGDARSPAEDQDLDDEDAPRDGRQFLGWASKQVPDLKGILIGYGKKKGLHSKIVEWTPQQVAAAYRFARSRIDLEPKSLLRPPEACSERFRQDMAAEHGPLTFRQYLNAKFTETNHRPRNRRAHRSPAESPR